MKNYYEIFFLQIAVFHIDISSRLWVIGVSNIENRTHTHTHTHTSGRQLKMKFLDVLDYSEYSDTNTSNFCFSRKHSFLSEEAKCKLFTSFEFLFCSFKLYCLKIYFWNSKFRTTHFSLFQCWQFQNFEILAILYLVVLNFDSHQFSYLIDPQHSSITIESQLTLSFLSSPLLGVVYLALTDCEPGGYLLLLIIITAAKETSLSLSLSLYKLPRL